MGGDNDFTFSMIPEKSTIPRRGIPSRRLLCAPVAFGQGPPRFAGAEGTRRTEAVGGGQIIENRASYSCAMRCSIES